MFFKFKYKLLLYKKTMDIPIPSHISTMWNFGSIIGIFMFLQIMSGWFLSMHYINNSMEAFNSYKMIYNDIYYGYMIQFFHMNFSSVIFFFIFMHILKSFLNSSFNKKIMWMSGNISLFITMAISFFGYVLPWGQMSFWGATVITNIVSSVPLIGKDLTNWIWGDFFVSKETLNKFFSLHFFLPMVLVILMVMHLNFLHKSGSSNQLGIISMKDMMDFNKFFSSKDLIYIFALVLIYSTFMLLILSFHTYMAKENYSEIDPLNTPSHIKPEWYFMLFYVMLRSIPNKTGGILFLLFFLFLFFFMFFKKKTFFSKFFFLKKTVILLLIMQFTFLISMGYKEIEKPYENFSLFMSISILMMLVLI